MFARDVGGHMPSGSSITDLTATGSDPTAAASAVPIDDATIDTRTEGSGLTGTWALFVGLGLLMVGNGLNGAVVGVRSTNEGFSLTVTGAIMAGFFAGFLLAPTVVVRMLRRVGHVRVFAGLASTASSAVLVHAIAVFPISWTLMRFIFGFCVAGLYIVIESWLAEMTTVTNRGRTMAIYMIVWLAGLGAGQYLIALADPNTFRLFVVSSVLVSMSLVPIALVTTKAPVVVKSEKVTVRELVRIVPTGVLGSFMGGASVGIVLGLGAVYATTIELSLDRTAIFLIAPMIGAMALQWPIGWLSDRISRRTVIFFVALSGLTITLALTLVPTQSLALPALMAALGGTLFPLYSLIVTYTIDWVPVGKVTGAAATLIGINGAGAFVGPLVAAPLMSAFGPKWFFWCMVGAFGIVAGYVAWRLVSKEAMPRERQKRFVPFPARAGYLAMTMAIEPVRKATRMAGAKNAAARQPISNRAEPDRGGAVPGHVDPDG
jgi:MFS family permease